jgi:hypothetical protein
MSGASGSLWELQTAPLRSEGGCPWRRVGEVHIASDGAPLAAAGRNAAARVASPEASGFAARKGSCLQLE